MKRPIVTLLMYFIINDRIADFCIGRYPSLWWLAAIAFAATTVIYTVEYLRNYRIPERPLHPRMKRKWWVAVELLTAVCAVTLCGWGCWYFGYSTVHFGQLLIEILLLLPTGLHIEALGKS